MQRNNEQIIVNGFFVIWFIIFLLAKGNFRTYSASVNNLRWVKIKSPFLRIKFDSQLMIIIARS